MRSAAIVHPSNLLGKELREALEKRPEPWLDLRLLSSREDEVGALTEVAGTAAVVGRYEPDCLEGVLFAFFCGRAADNRPLLRELPRSTRAIVLSTDATAADGLPVVMGVSSPAALTAPILLSPHPAAVMLAHLLWPLRALRCEEIVATVVQPASIYDQAGLEALFEETRQIVALTARRAHAGFGAQLAFNLLPARSPAEPIAAELHALIPELPPAHVQLLQGATFHSIAASVYLRCAGGTGLAAVRKALATHPYLAPAERPRLLGPVDAAGGDKILYAPPRQDGPGAFWLWVAMDNLLRGGALNAVEIAEAIR
jgi:aspartate-semialdehyde dehydrogenase